MSRFPSPTLADRIDDRIQELADGVVRLGDEDTPFTLHGGGESLEAAQQRHSERDERERERDEESNEPVTRAFSTWRADMVGLDVPFVDTIPLAEQRRRANHVAEFATDEGVVDRIDRNVAFQDDTVRGKYWRGVGVIEIGTNPVDFPGFQAGVVLAHEVGHAFYDAWSPDSGIEEQPRRFRTTDETEQAVALSERLHGPMVETDGPFVDYRKGSDEELAAAVSRPGDQPAFGFTVPTSYKSGNGQSSICNGTTVSGDRGIRRADGRCAPAHRREYQEERSGASRTDGVFAATDSVNPRGADGAGEDYEYA